LIREAKLFSEKSSQENKIFIDCARGTEDWSSGTLEFRSPGVQESEGRRVDCATAYVLTAPANGDEHEDEDDRVPNPANSKSPPLPHLQKDGANEITL